MFNFIDYTPWTLFVDLGLSLVHFQIQIILYICRPIQTWMCIMTDRKRILVVDDEVTLCDALAFNLEEVDRVAKELQGK